MPKAKRNTPSKGKRSRKAAAETAAAALVNLAESYGVQVVPAQVAAGQSYWRVTGVRHLTPDENRGRHNVYVDALDESGHRSREVALRIGWTWDGRHPDEPADPKPLDKPDDEPAGTVDIFSGQRIEVWIEGDGLASDHVANLHTDHPDEPDPSGELWNSRGHHSFHVVFQRTAKPAEDGGSGVEPQPAAFRFEVWPTEFKVVTQPFGANPQDYAPFGLPGHEGVDIRAKVGTKILCVAPGQVKLVHRGTPPHNYGIHVRVLHAGGYETIYGHLQSAAVVEGQQVAAGQVLGLADNTGNSRGDHLHLTLKHHGETFDGYPGSIVDPTPFLAPLLAGEGAALSATAAQMLVADKLGLNCNAPTDEQGNITPRLADPALIADTGVRWVRLNFILRPFTSPTDPAWIDTYRRIIQGLRARGLKIYGLVGAEAVAGDPGNQFRDAPGNSIANDWIRRYAENFRLIVQQFRDDVEVFESFNEPNNWHQLPGETWQQAWIHASWFAVMLQRVFEQVRDLDVTLVSGPLLSTEDGNDAADYLPKVYRAGKKLFGWGQPGVPFPFDGVGYHPYVSRDPADPAQSIPVRYRQYMDAVRRAIIEAEGVLKPLYLSEIGWQNAEDRQVECMRVGVRCALDDPTVALCLWYGMQDDGAEVYGLYRKEGLATDHRKLVYEPFVALARENRLVPAAATQPAPLVDHATFAGEFDAIPDGTVLPPGSAFTKTWRLLNKGTTTWSAGYRLLRVSGHSLGAPASIAVPQCPPGQAVDLTVAFVAPTAAEDYKSTWQLVDPQGRPFGQQVWTEIKVRVAPVTLAVGGVALAELPLPAGPAAGQPAAAAALGIIYTTYWLRMLSASSAPDPQPALLAAANDALAQIREWLEQEA